MEDLKRQPEEERKEKDKFFKLSPQSPIPYKDRSNFDSLNYYPVKLELRFELELHEYKDKKEIKIEDTKKNTRRFIRWGKFRFNVGGKKCTLQAYKSDSREEGLFVPFRDVTSGQETYGAGRYLDLSLRNRTSNGKWVLDFNKVYNPWCVYSNNYACPFVPPENWLRVPIKAGEKNYPYV